MYDAHIQEYKTYAKLITGYEDFILLHLYRTFRPDIVKRTEQQNKALHKYYELLAEGLNDAGYDMRVFLEKAPRLDVPWTKESIKEYLWRPVQRAMENKESTTELNKIEVNEIYEALDRRVSELTGVHIEFPSEESLYGGEKCQKK